MAWNEQWSFKIDGTEINRNASNPTGTFIVQIPELENQFEQDAILVEIDGDYPAFVRMQPREGQYTILISMTPCTWGDYQTRLQTLKTLLSPGQHTLTVQARGMPTAKSVVIVVKSMQIDAKIRLVTVAAVVPRPVLV
jgi:hypothetical protein